MLRGVAVGYDAFIYFFFVSCTNKKYGSSLVGWNPTPFQTMTLYSFSFVNFFNLKGD